MPNYPTEDEMKKIEQHCINEREKLMLLLSFYSALRAGELLSLTLAHFNREAWKMNEDRPCQLKVTGKRTQRITLVKPFIMKRLREWSIKNVKNENQRLWKIHYHRWGKLFRQASRRSLGKAYSLHSLRHGGATWLLNNGWSLLEVSEFLGHKSIATTQIYAHLDKNKLMEKYANL